VLEHRVNRREPRDAFPQIALTREQKAWVQHAAKLRSTFKIQ
jgi:hypothetical protein